MLNQELNSNLQTNRTMAIPCELSFISDSRWSHTGSRARNGAYSNMISVLSSIPFRDGAVSKAYWCCFCHLSLHVFWDHGHNWRVWVYVCLPIDTRKISYKCSCVKR